MITSQNAKQLQNLVTGLIEGVVVKEDDKEWKDNLGKLRLTEPKAKDASWPLVKKMGLGEINKQLDELLEHYTTTLIVTSTPQKSQSK